jgi:hypothetical protein
MGLFREHEDRGGSSSDQSPKDDRTDAMRPGRDSYAADQANREEQQSRGW